MTPIITKELSRDIQAIKISCKVSNLTKVTILVNMYDSPEILSYKKKTDLYILKTMLLGALLVATNLLNTYIYKFY